MATKLIDPRDALDRMPKRRRKAILAYVNTIETADLVPLAIFLKGLRPDTTDTQLARMLGVSRAELATWKEYQAIKPSLADFARIERQPRQWRIKAGERWPLDHPDRIRDSPPIL